jgi:uncharacterized protein YbaR (Trm112 family)
MQSIERVREIIDTIVCPVCHGLLALEGESITCRSCLRCYPVEEGIPVLLASRASLPIA